MIKRRVGLSTPAHVCFMLVVNTVTVVVVLIGATKTLRAQTQQPEGSEKRVPEPGATADPAAPAPATMPEETAPPTLGATKTSITPSSVAEPVVALLVVLATAPEVPAGLLARVRGELLASGFRLGTAVEATTSSVWVFLRQSPNSLVAEVRKGSAAAREPQVVIVSLPNGVATGLGDRINAFSELALRVADLVQIMQLPAVSASAPDPSAARPVRASVATGAVRPSGKTEAPSSAPWMVAVSTGLASGLLEQQPQLIGTFEVSRLVTSQVFLGAHAGLPLQSASAQSDAGEARVGHLWTTLDVGYERPSLRGRFIPRVYASVGVARTKMQGTPTPPFRANDEILWSAVAKLGASGCLRVWRNVFAILDVSAMTFVPRTGVRLGGVAVATSAWVMPSASLGAGMSW